MNSAVTLIFFNRADTLERVFAQVRKARPPKLFLVQDGARSNNSQDVEDIQACRDIVDNVDWNCEVYKNYSQENLGCGVRPQSGITWVLSQVESTIILEDDCVPDMSFFDYCDELLEKYKDDQRVCYISGLNHFEEWSFGNSSYGFTKGGAIWGWATWRRAWDAYDYAVNGINNTYVQNLLQRTLVQPKQKIALWKKTSDLVNKGYKISYWDVQWGFVKYSRNQLVIVPKYNLISNIGVGTGSTHATADCKRHRRYYDYNFMPTKSLEFPLIHPEHMICDTEYDDLLARCNKKNGQRMFWQIVKRKIMNILKKREKK